MTTEELAELFLVSLYDMAEAAPHPYFLFTMNEFAPRMGITDMAELRKALSILEDKGLVYLASTDAWGGVSAGITMEGSVHAEKGGETGIIERFRKDPSSFGNVSQPELSSLPGQTVPPESASPEPCSQPPTSDPSGGMLDAVLSEMATAAQNETTLDSSARKDLLSDIATLRIQLSKQTRSQPIIMEILDNLSGVPSLLPLARLVIRFLTPHSS